MRQCRLLYFDQPSTQFPHWIQLSWWQRNQQGQLMECMFRRQFGAKSKLLKKYYFKNARESNKSYFQQKELLRENYSYLKKCVFPINSKKKLHLIPLSLLRDKQSNLCSCRILYTVELPSWVNTFQGPVTWMNPESPMLRYWTSGRIPQCHCCLDRPVQTGLNRNSEQRTI